MKLAALLLPLALLAAPVPGVAAEEFEDYREIYRDLARRHGDAVVPVKFVISVPDGANQQRIEDRTQGLLVSTDGLVLVPARAVSVDLGIFGGGGPGQAAPMATSSEFRVRLPGSEEWLDADLVTRDGELGLAWLRLRETPGKLPFVDLSQGARAEPGMVFFSLLRTSDEWGGVPVFRPGLVLGETRTPTFRLLVDGVPGMAFSHDGRPMGFVDVDLASLARQGNTGIGLDMADLVLRMTPVERVAAATAQAARLPVVRAD
ncbi:hypothetical protein [Arenimonas fontis]|uniref:Serine protease n=1 Tax=Arenimonas fontis TaxID=2608255 RepID=A0A5B2ZDA0_9GAMM|nr:hypothetical protein [Arenimonas fontis]KAA2286136.1 hypothetical protein F0415_01125 [Arenimonas fontis]